MNIVSVGLLNDLCACSKLICRDDEEFLYFFIMDHKYKERVCYSLFKQDEKTLSIRLTRNFPFDNDYSCVVVNVPYIKINLAIIEFLIHIEKVYHECRKTNKEYYNRHLKSDHYKVKICINLIKKCTSPLPSDF